MATSLQAALVDPSLTFPLTFMEPYGATQVFGSITTVVAVPSPPPPETSSSDLPSSDVKGLAGNGGTPTPGSSPSPSKAPASGPNKALVGAAAVLGVAALAGVVAGVVLYRRNKRKAKYIEKLEYQSNPVYDKDGVLVREVPNVQHLGVRILQSPSVYQQFTYHLH